MKKYLSVLLAAVLALSLFSGCAPVDSELMDALNLVAAAENVTATESLKFSVETIEPYSDAYFEYIAESINSDFALAEKLGNRFEIQTETQKQGSISSIEYKLIMPDLRTKVNMWGNVKEDGTVQSVVKIPSYITPIMLDSGLTKKYISIDTSKMNEMEQLASFDMKGYTEIINNLSLKLVDKITFPVTEKNGNTYTVKLDGNTLEGLTKDIMAILAEDDIANEICSAYYILIEMALASSEAEVDFPAFEEFTAMYKDGLTQAQPYADAICAAIIESGLLQNGFKSVYTLNSNGLVEKAETEFVIDLDFAKIETAFNKIDDVVAGTVGLETPPEKSGKFKITVQSTADYTYGNAQVNFPELTEENTVDYYADLMEYTEYNEARTAWYDEQYWSWISNVPKYVFYEDSEEYGYYGEHKVLSEIKLKNADTGLEETLPVDTVVLDTEPFPYNYFYYVELEKVVPFFTDLEMTWNEETLCYELRCGDILIAVPSIEAAYRLSEIEETGEYTGEYYDSSYSDYRRNGRIMYARNFVDGKCYIDIEYLTDLLQQLSFYDNRYQYKYEDDTLFIRKEEYKPFVYDKDMSGNFFMMF